MFAVTCYFARLFPTICMTVEYMYIFFFFTRPSQSFFLLYVFDQISFAIMFNKVWPIKIKKKERTERSNTKMGKMMMMMWEKRRFSVADAVCCLIFFPSFFWRFFLGYDSLNAHQLFCFIFFVCFFFARQKLFLPNLKCVLFFYRCAFFLTCVCFCVYNNALYRLADHQTKEIRCLLKWNG